MAKKSPKKFKKKTQALIEYWEARKASEVVPVVASVELGQFQIEIPELSQKTRRRLPPPDQG